MAGDSSQLLHPQRQGVPAHLWSLKQILLPIQNYIQICLFPVPVSARALISQHRPPSLIYTNNGPPFMSSKFTKFLQHHHIDHITHPPISPGLLDSLNIKLGSSRPLLSTKQDAGKSLKELLLDLQSTPIRPNMPSPQTILHNRTFQCPSKPSTPVDIEHV